MTGRAITLSYCVVTILLLAAGALAFHSLNTTVEALDLETHAQEVMVQIESVGRLVSDAESSRRAFVLSGREGFREAHSTAEADMQSTLARLRELIADNSRQLHHLDALQPLVHEMLETHAASFKAYEKTPQDRDGQSVFLQRGRILGIRIRKIIDEMRNEEKTLLNQRSQAADLVSHTSKILIGGVLLLALAITAGAGVVAVRANKDLEQGRLKSRQQADMLQTVLNSMGEGVIVADRDGRFKVFNPSATHLLGVGSLDIPPEEWSKRYSVVNADLETPFPPEQLPLSRAIRGESVDNVELIVKHPKGSLVYLNLSARPLRSAEGQVNGGVVVFNDVTSRKHSVEEVRNAKEQLEHLVTKLEQRHQENEVLYKMDKLIQSCRFLPEAFDLISQSAGKLFSCKSATLFIMAASRNHLEAVNSWGTEPDKEHGVLDPEECWALRLSAVHDFTSPDSDSMCPHIGKPVPSLCIPLMTQEGVLGLISVQPGEQADLEELKSVCMNFAEHVTLALSNLRLRETLRNQSLRDPLTGLFNRRYMEESLVREFARAERRKRPIGLIMLDLDHFKQFNDTHGHAGGDTLLREVGGLLKMQVRKEDIVSRYGGEEFLIILPDSSLEATVARASKIRDNIRNMIVKVDGKALDSVTASLGVAARPDHGIVPEDLVRAADKALYLAKTQGRDRVVVSTESYSNGSVAT